LKQKSGGNEQTDRIKYLRFFSRIFHWLEGSKTVLLLVDDVSLRSKAEELKLFGFVCVPLDCVVPVFIFLFRVFVFSGCRRPPPPVNKSPPSKFTPTPVYE
jgi:hypothetical protein